MLDICGFWHSDSKSYYVFGSDSASVKKKLKHQEGGAFGQIKESVLYFRKSRLVSSTCMLP